MPEVPEPPEPPETKPTQPAPPASLTVERVRRIAALCRLRLDESELERERVRLDAVLGYMAQLRDQTPGEADDADRDDLGALDLKNAPLAPDEPSPALDPGVVAKLAPDSVGPYIRVPRVLDGGGA